MVYRIHEQETRKAITHEGEPAFLVRMKYFVEKDGNNTTSLTWQEMRDLFVALGKKIGEKNYFVLQQHMDELHIAEMFKDKSISHIPPGPGLVT
jgi:hypothetical protein